MANDSARCRAKAWLILATLAVAGAGLFAILIALARVPTLGKLFPGPEFYRVALTLHVDLSQWVWFMAFTGMLWSLASRRENPVWDWFALALAGMGALAMAASPLFGRAIPMMSNYLPVLDSPLFMAGLLAYGGAVMTKAILAIGEGIAAAGRDERATRIALSVAAVVVLAALVLLTWSYQSAVSVRSGHDYFETLFWGAGHVWQFSLTTLMMLCWAGLVSSQHSAHETSVPALAYVLGAMPALGALTFPLFMSPADSSYFASFTALMRWTSWEIPLLVCLMLLLKMRRTGGDLPIGLGLSILLFVSGLILGAAITAETTLVTAHYHGTVGAVTLAFMAYTYRVLPLLDLEEPRQRQVSLQLRLYGWGILLMMAGLAGAGLMGAPRKLPGNLGFELNIETFSRLLLGVGGTLATIGILMFAYLVATRLKSFQGLPRTCTP